MGLSVGTSSEPHLPSLHACAPGPIPAACERDTSCVDDRRSLGADCFERGPVPFADFLYHENRKLALEHPRTQHCEGDAGPDCGQTRPESPSTSENVQATRAMASPIRGRDARGSAIVLNHSRPEFVARFIDLYA